jgi:enamine deaminase RidA (YjgF/YER057c/UK114 family)
MSLVALMVLLQLRPVATPAVEAGDYIYLSGQGAHAEGEARSSTFEEQADRALSSLKAVLETAGLKLSHVVYTHVYLEDLRKLDHFDSIYARYFPETPPARAVVGVAKLDGTPVLIEAVAVRSLAERRVITVPGRNSGEPQSDGILTRDRLFLSAARGGGSEPAAAVDAALEGLRQVLEIAGLSMQHLVFVNPYLTREIPLEVMNERYARRFELGNTPARATIWVESLPGGATIEYTGVAVRNLGERRAVRPKNMAPSPTASPCVFARDTLYCSAKSGFIPGPASGIYTPDVALQLRQTMRNLLDGLEEAELGFGDVVATRFYLDDLADLRSVEDVYREYLEEGHARTILQQLAPAERKPDDKGRYPTLEQISLIAVKRSRN